MKKQTYIQPNVAAYYVGTAQSMMKEIGLSGNTDRQGAKPGTSFPGDDEGSSDSDTHPYRLWED